MGMSVVRRIKAVFQHCEQATFLIVKDEEHALDRKERIQMKIHLLFCNACRRFRQQSHLINSWIKQQQHEPLHTGLTAEEKEKLNRIIEENS